MDPVISSKYGMRPLLDLPALDVASETCALKPSTLTTMASPTHHRLHSQEQQTVSGPQGAGLPMAPLLPLPADWPYAARLPGSLFAAPPGPLPFKNPQLFPYSFLHMSPFTQQPPPYPITDISGQPVQTMDLSPEHQIMSRLYPGVHDPCPPQSYGAPNGLPPPGLVPQYSQLPQAVGFQAADAAAERVHFQGVLTYGELSATHRPDKSSMFWSLPKFLRQELYKTYGHVPATDVQIVARGGEFHVYASPSRPAGDMTDNKPALSFDERLIVD